jgi:formylglycine-generating enzyme required for sulfatase activity
MFPLLPANEFPIKFVLIPAGKFQMGSPKTDKDRQADEGPQHEVTLSKPFYMGMYHVTQAQFFNVTGRKISGFQGPAHNPVENVTCDDALEFCQKLSERMERKVRLPTEAEWEYACRAGTATPLNTGETLSQDEANFDGDSANGNGQKGEWRQKPTPVGTFKPNAFGLYDMHGNVWEWCADWYGDYASGAVTDPQGPASGEHRVLRGGSWDYYGSEGPGNCRAAIRTGCCLDDRTNYYGFRVVVSVSALGL